MEKISSLSYDQDTEDRRSRSYRYRSRSRSPHSRSRSRSRSQSRHHRRQGGDRYDRHSSSREDSKQDKVSSSKRRRDVSRSQSRDRSTRDDRHEDVQSRRDRRDMRAKERDDDEDDASFSRRDSKSRKKKSKKRASSDSSSSGSESDNRSRDRKKKKKKKERETSEERRKRKEEQKAEKKLLKEELRQQKEAQIAAEMSASLGYSNTENPFGDSSLHTKFVWAKKRQQEVKEGLSKEERLQRKLARQREKQEELDKLKRRRVERDIEMQLREQEQMRLQREQDMLAMGDWESKEEEFHFEQALNRAKIRVKEARAKPIDLLVMQLLLAQDANVVAEFEDAGLEISTDEPYLIFNDLDLDEVEELHLDIQNMLKLERDDDAKKFWEAILIVCDDQLSQMRLRVSGGPPTGVSESVLHEIHGMFRHKNEAQLADLQRQIEDKLRRGGPIDVEYWEAALKALIIWKAKAKLRTLHEELLKQRLKNLRLVQEDRGITESSSRTASKIVAKVAAKENVDEEEGMLYEYDPSMSPKLSVGIPKDAEDWDILLPEEEQRKLEEARRIIIDKYTVSTEKKEAELFAEVAEQTGASAFEEAYVAENVKDIGMDESAFTEEANIQGPAYLWQDKYRPRKPRYFNRVHTGYEWNKYNQTHYDYDNPPPKVVKGYKFNIFYPDLIDKSTAPTFKVEKDPQGPDTKILRFIAGPPYEDIAFRIVNREWEYARKKGFRCSFDRGVLQLWFHFRRNYYRR